MASIRIASMMTAGIAGCLALTLSSCSTSKTLPLGSLKVTSGAIIVGDPCYLPDTDNVTIVKDLPNGDFPVSIRVAKEAGDQRVATATLVISKESPTSRQLLGEIGVDSGTACFVDVHTAKQFYKEVGPDRIGILGGPEHKKNARKIQARFGVDCVVSEDYSQIATPVSETLERDIQGLLDKESDGGYFQIITNGTYDRMCSAMEKTYVPTYNTTNLVIDGRSRANLVAFSTGYGDGGYPLYGYYKDKQLVKLELEMLVQ